MNDLSWLIYWANVLPGLATALCIVSGFACCGLIIMIVLGLTGFFGDEAKHRDGGYHYTTAAELAPRFRRLWPLIIPAFFLWLGSFMVPNRDAFYLIAASEAGEKATQTPEFDKVRQVINKFLDDQLRTEPKALNEETHS